MPITVPLSQVSLHRPFVASREQPNGQITLYLQGDDIPPTPQESALFAAQREKIAGINDECKRRLFARFGPPEEQVSRLAGVYGEDERIAMPVGIATMIDAANVGQNAVLSATTVQDVEAVTVTWPVI